MHTTSPPKHFPCSFPCSSIARGSLLSWPSLLTQFVLDGLQDAVRVAQHARRGGADLDEVLAHRLAQEHGIEGGHLVHPHRRDLKHLGHLTDNMAVETACARFVFFPMTLVEKLALFMTLTGSHPCCLWAKSNTGMVAACLWPTGYIEMIDSILYGQNDMPEANCA